MPNVFKLILLTATIALPLVASAQVYKWVDENGKTHFSDQPPAKNTANQVELPTINGMKQVEYTPSDTEKRVVMYSTQWCGYCRKAREYFKDKKIRYKEKDIEKSSRAKKEYDRLKGSGVPLIMVGKNKIQGFDLGKFEDAYY